MNICRLFRYGMRVLLPCISLLALTGLAEAQLLAPGNVTVSATFQSISVSANFSGDSNGNAIASIRFRKGAGDSFHQAYPPFIDRRATIGGVANPYANQARGSIVGLSENTSYDVEVTWSDPNGIVGSQPSVVTISTLTSSPPTGSGTTRNVIDDKTLASALAAMNSGDVVNLAAGTYAPFTISRSGSAGAWIVINCGNEVTISGVGINQNILIDASYIILQNCTLSVSDFHGLIVNKSNVFVKNNSVQGFSRLCADGPATTHYGDMGIGINSGLNNVYVMNNTVVGHTNLIGCFQSPSYDGPGTGIQIFDCTTCVISGNTVIGNGTRNAISSDQSANALVNVDISNNRVSGYVDDGIEFKGQNRNTRAWGNVITQDGNGRVGGNSCMSNESTLGTNLFGPSYYFRNTCRVIRTAGGCAYKGPSGPLYFFHNSVNAAGVPGSSNWAFGCGASSVGSGPYVMLNNASVITNSMTERAPAATSTFDYNCGVTTGSYAYQFNNTTSYSTFAEFRSATGQEAHSINADPQFIDAALQIGATSPAVDKGIILLNFNSLDSAWPYSGTAPDMGAFEAGAGGSNASPAVPQNLQVR